ncbi:hypothetical protein [Actinoplanes palleronii]|uniref:Uncharacterized protein n=1 Tax=Actinoplanes palleronii TaxID=113570 RepID=A0ABQ4B3Z1_9ACTN|nr:hypothetical protein [Actinoplanes palleronii]GIE65370.1 hypothetical protein Apa02nite_014780 [Actinoplanes palleronii]
MTLSLFDTGQIAGPSDSSNRTSFAFVGPSGEVPLIDYLAAPRTRPDQTARIFLAARPVEPDPLPEPTRPWFYRGQRRWTRSAGLLVAATWPGGLR